MLIQGCFKVTALGYASDAPRGPNVQAGGNGTRAKAVHALAIWIVVLFRWRAVASGAALPQTVE
jgi:hypothetical protein